MLRCLQGLLFLGVALVALKWEFHGSRDMGFIAPTGDVFYRANSFFEASPPWHIVDKVVEAAILASVGFYLWLTGEVMRCAGRGWRYSPVTFLAVMSAFLAVFTAKFAYHRGDPSGYYPPFNSVSLGAVYALFSLLTAYYLVIGEIQFWRRKAELPNREPQTTAPAPGGSVRQEGITGGRGG
jgi:hypothetical protein